MTVSAVSITLLIEDFTWLQLPASFHIAFACEKMWLCQQGRLQIALMGLWDAVTVRNPNYLLSAWTEVVTAGALFWPELWTPVITISHSELLQIQTVVELLARTTGLSKQLSFWYKCYSLSLDYFGLFVLVNTETIYRSSLNSSCNGPSPSLL